MLDKVRARRLIYARLLIPLAVGILVVRLWYVQIVEGRQFQQQANQNHLRVDVIEPPRGIIYDRYDQQLVENAPSWDVLVIPADLERSNVHDVLALLARLTQADLSKLEQEVRDDRDNPALPLPLIHDVPRDTALMLTEQLDSLPGVHITATAQRHYVGGAAFADVLGYVGKIDRQQYDASQHTAQPYALDDTAGQAGIEKLDEAQLRGKLGHMTMVVDVGGRTVGTLGEQQPTAGDSVELTLDAGVQRAGYQALLEAVRQAGGTEGAAVALDPRDGAVIALISVPSYDPNSFVGGISPANWARLTTDPAHPLLDHAIAAQYPPGSILNAFIAAAALQEHLVKADQTLACPSVLSEQGWNFYNSLNVAAGPFTLPQALAAHCDNLFAALSGGAQTPSLRVPGLGSAKLLSWLGAFGFAQPTGIDLPGEASGFLPDPSWYRHTQDAAWTPIDTYLVAAGAGPFAVTPLQVATATAALANGGTIWQPTLLQRLIAPDGGVLQQLQPHAARRLGLTPTVVRAVQDGLALSVASGSSRALQVRALRVAGAGASAAPNSGGVGQAGVDSWWTSFAPLEDPQLVVTVLVAGGDAPGAADAAMPVARAMFEAYFKPAKADTAVHVDD